MGFKDIQEFNLALLAKQAWRLIHNTHSLFYCVYKLRHFPHCSFMDAEVGSNPSYVWRSLLAARDVIFEGSKWEVGDGSRIEVSTHKWISHKPLFLVEIQPNLFVKDIIDTATGQWDREKVFDLFAHRTWMEILQIPLPNAFSRDILVWKKTQSKIFTVKSAYQVALWLKNKSCRSILVEEGENWRWRIYLDGPNSTNKSGQIQTDIRWTNQKVMCHSINHCVISKKL